MTHLGERVSPLVDGQLSVEATERAHAHLAHCRDCRDAVEAERLLKARLRCLPSPAPDVGLVARLLAMGGPEGPMPPRPGHVPGSPRPEPVFVSAAVPSGTPAGSMASMTSPGSIEPPPYANLGLPGRRAASGSSLRPGSRSGSAPVRPTPGRPSGRSTGRWSPRAGAALVDRRRARLAGAVLGALGVVGAGIGGLVLVGPTASRGTPAPAQAPLDSFVVQRTVATPPGAVSADVSLRLQARRSYPADDPSSSASGSSKGR